MLRWFVPRFSFSEEKEKRNTDFIQVPVQVGQAPYPHSQRHQRCTSLPSPPDTLRPLDPVANSQSQVLFASGDTLAQQAVDRRGLEKHDFARTGRMALYGGGTTDNTPMTLSPLSQD